MRRVFAFCAPVLLLGTSLLSACATLSHQDTVCLKQEGPGQYSALGFEFAEKSEAASFMPETSSCAMNERAFLLTFEGSFRLNLGGSNAAAVVSFMKPRGGPFRVRLEPPEPPKFVESMTRGLAYELNPLFDHSKSGYPVSKTGELAQSRASVCQRWSQTGSPLNSPESGLSVLSESCVLTQADASNISNVVNVTLWVRSAEGASDERALWSHLEQFEKTLRIQSTRQDLYAFIHSQEKGAGAAH